MSDTRKKLTAKIAEAKLEAEFETKTGKSMDKASEEELLGFVNKRKLGKKLKVKKDKVALANVPAPERKIEGVKNPLFEKNGLKRALAVAILMECKGDKTKAAAVIFHSGIMHEHGLSKENPTTKIVEHDGGVGYARWADEHRDSYMKKAEEKVKTCREYAKVLVAKHGK